MLKKEIINYSKKLGIDLIGFTTVVMVPELKVKLEKQAQLNYSCEFQKGEIKEKINPSLLMANAKSIIAIGLGYPRTAPALEQITKNDVYFGSSSWGIDYHKVLKQRLEGLATYIKQKSPNFEYKIIVDNSPLCDRAIAYQAGLGFFGKNNLLINEEYGSYIFLGSLLTNLELEPDVPLNKTCLECNRCLNSCPTGALTEMGLLDSKKCLSYLTQKRGELTMAEKELMNNCLYGCDICQRVCPYNKRNNNQHLEFQPTGIEFISLSQYKPLSNKEFKLQYGHLAGAWRGPQIIKRNIEIYKNKSK